MCGGGIPITQPYHSDLGAGWLIRAFSAVRVEVAFKVWVLALG